MTQQEQIDELIENFEFLEEWEDRYGFLIDHGRSLPKMEDVLKTEQTKIKGCQSQVWIFPQAKQKNGKTVIEFLADSDSSLVKGLVAILHSAYFGQTKDAILSYDIEGLLLRLGLSEHLSMNRRNGLMGMIQRIKMFAEVSG